MKTRSSIKAAIGATGVVLVLTAGPAMADLSKATVRKIANQEIDKGVPALIGATGPQGPTGATGATGPAGPAAVQRYVHVFSDGTVDASRSLGVTQANTGSSDGFYCFTGLGLVRGGQVSVDFNDALSNETAQFGVTSTAGCESLVVTFDPAGNPAPTGFFLNLY